ncbi:MAG: DUF3626 domain-containing protein [Mucilaginibacter sp.]|uniref:DUF3626 domain-containing protein n=1 Tax=Mucilaginibacter sp. TaxID=1882438 RepID=UPI0031AABAC8
MKQALDRIKEYGSRKPIDNFATTNLLNRFKNFTSTLVGRNITFQPSIRPKYAALNYAKLKYGGAPMYGQSYMILKEYVKDNCTFLHADSLTPSILNSHLAKQTHLYRLILNMNPLMLKIIDDVMNKTDMSHFTHLPGLSAVDYLEAQIHTEIKFNRDVKSICISRNELWNAEIETRKLVNQGKAFTVKSRQELEDIYNEFANKNGIELKIL